MEYGDIITWDTATDLGSRKLVAYFREIEKRIEAAITEEEKTFYEEQKAKRESLKIQYSPEELEIYKEVCNHYNLDFKGIIRNSLRRIDTAPAEVLQLLEKEELNTRYLDLGQTENFWYYGINLNGQEAIITSDGKTYRNTLEVFKNKSIGKNEIKEYFNYDGYIGGIAPVWRNKSIAKYLKGEVTADKRQLYEEIKGKINYYMDFGEQQNIADVQACWVLATYCYPLFYWFPHILFNAPSESGKSKNAFILMKMSFRGFDLGTAGGVTPAQMFRTLEANRGTVLIDEFEKLEKSESQMLVNQILNASATRDAYVIRTEQIERKWRAWKFPIFCPKIVCNISGINQTSLSRFIPFQLLKTTSNKGKKKPYREADQAAFKPIQDMGHILILQHWEEIKKTYDDLELPALKNREEDSWLPICAIAKWLGPDVLNSVLSYVKEYQEIKIQNNDTKETLFLTIYEHVGKETDFYSPQAIAEMMGDIIGHYKSPATWVGRVLSSYKFKSKRSGKGNLYELSKEKVKNILDRYFPQAEIPQEIKEEKIE